MERRVALATLSALAVLASCSGGTTLPPAVPGEELEVRTSLETTTLKARRGDLATLVFKIRNGSRNAVLLRDLTQPRDPLAPAARGAVVTWQFSQPGLVTYLPDKDEWLHERAKRSETRSPVFNSGLIVPGETLTVRARIRLLEMPLDFRFSYFELSPDDLRRKVYWEFRKDKEVRYKPLLGPDLELRLVPEKRAEDGGHRVVVFPHADPLKATSTLLKTVRVTEDLAPRTFDLDAALARSGTKPPLPGTYTFTSALDAWVLPKGDGHVLVNPLAVTPLPRLEDPERVFYFVDSISPKKLEVELRGDSVASAMQELKYPLVVQERKVKLSASVSETRKDYFLFVTPQELPKLLADARTFKFTVGVEYGVEGSGRLQLSYR